VNNDTDNAYGSSRERTATAGAVASVASGVTAAAMVATPLLPKGGRARRVLSSVVVVGSFAATTANAVLRWGLPRATTAATITAASTTLVERIGTRTGLPFGRYEYTRALQPQIAGVPAIVPLAWFAMGVPAREAAHAALGPRPRPATRIVLGAAALTAWDLFLDPQMVGEGYWRWARRGVYRGIPLSNFVGWFVTSLAVMAALEVLLPPDEDADGALVGEYTFMGVMETIGFARFFRDPVVAVVGGLAMLPVAAAAVAGKVRA
jgi:putative membrane protein